MTTLVAAHETLSMHQSEQAWMYEEAPECGVAAKRRARHCSRLIRSRNRAGWRSMAQRALFA
jgi:hypothetical protein